MKKPKEKSIRFSVNLEGGQYEILEELAGGLDLSKAQLIRRAVREFLSSPTVQKIQLDLSKDQLIRRVVKELKPDEVK